MGFSEDEKHDENEEKMQLVKSEIIDLNHCVSANTGSVAPSVCDSEVTTSSLSTSTNIASTIMEYGASFSAIQSDKECDDENDTKMSMVHVSETKTVNAFKPKITKSKRARNKLKKKKNKIAMKKKKKNQKKVLPQTEEIRDEEMLSVTSSELSKSPSIDTIAADIVRVDED